MKVYYSLDNDLIECDLEGATTIGKDEVLLLQDVNLLEDTPWHSEGYTIQPFLSASDFETVRDGLTKRIASMLAANGVAIDADFTLERYHTYVTDADHLVLSKQIQYGFNVSEFPIDFSKVDARISELLGKDVSAEAKHIRFDHIPEFYNFSMRIVRPGMAKDNNPPHRDVWIDRLRNAVNIYVPICGSTSKSSLPLIPGSHLLSEAAIERTAEGAFLNKTQYTVPCVLSVNGEIPKLIRPDPKETEVMLFSPYLVHGGGNNLNADRTRVSLEIRFFQRE